MGKIFRRRRGDVLQPARFTPEVVRALQAKTKEFDGQYMQSPVPASGRIFNPNWWRLYKSKAAPEFELIVLSVDCSFKSKSTSDYVSLLKWGVLGVRSYVVERRNERLGYIQTKAAIRDMQSRGRPASVILVESAANGIAVIEELQADPDFGASVIAIEPIGDKIARANAASADVEAGSVYLPEDAEWLGTFLRTFAAFPGVKNDDDVDSASMFINWRRTRNLAYGVLDLARQYESGERPLPPSVEEMTEKKAHAIVQADSKALAPVETPKCPHPDCGHPNTWLQLDHAGDWHVHCRQCGRVDGKDAPKPIDGNLCWVEGCGLPLVGSGDNRRCQNHGQVPPSTPPSAIAFQQRAAEGDRWRRLGQNALRVPDMTFPWSGRF